MNEERKGFGFEIPVLIVFYDVRYVEPSIRPDDSRYGENPNRLQRHTQFQVKLDILIKFQNLKLLDFFSRITHYYFYH